MSWIKPVFGTRIGVLALCLGGCVVRVPVAAPQPVTCAITQTPDGIVQVYVRVSGETSSNATLEDDEDGEDDNDMTYDSDTASDSNISALPEDDDATSMPSYDDGL